MFCVTSQFLHSSTCISFSSKQIQQSTQKTQNICITFVQRRPNVFDAGPTLYKCYKNILCSLGRRRVPESSTRFRNVEPRSALIQLVEGVKWSKRGLISILSNLIYIIMITRSIMRRVTRWPWNVGVTRSPTVTDSNHIPWRHPDFK